MVAARSTWLRNKIRHAREKVKYTTKIHADPLFTSISVSPESSRVLRVVSIWEKSIETSFGMTQ